MKKRHNKMVDRIRYPTVSYLPFYYIFFQFLLLTIFNLQANISTTKDILSNLGQDQNRTIPGKDVTWFPRVLGQWNLFICSTLGGSSTRDFKKHPRVLNVLMAKSINWEQHQENAYCNTRAMIAIFNVWCLFLI